MKITILGGGPAGLYSGLLIKKTNPAHEITIIERNAADVTYGWGVVFSDRTLASFQRADYKSYEQITNQFVKWDAIDVRYRGETIRCGGHVIAGIARMSLLNILQGRCREIGINLRFSEEINDMAELAGYDLLIAADGLNSVARKTYVEQFKPAMEYGKARYIWLGVSKVLDAFTFIFCENEHGLFQVHAYPYSGTSSTYLVECDEATWLNAGLDKASEAQSLAYCQRLLAVHLDGAKLLSNNSKWISFPTLKTKNWHYANIVLLGDAAHTAHFSIGSGTKLAMEDAIALAGALEQHTDLDTSLNAYELERKPVVEVFQRAASESQSYFETIKRYLGLEPVQFAFQLLTRSGRITYDDLRFRDGRFGEAVDRWHAQQTNIANKRVLPSEHPPQRLFDPAPMFNPLPLRLLTIPNRFVLARTVEGTPSGSPQIKSIYLPDHGILENAAYDQLLMDTYRGAGLILVEKIAVAAEGRNTPRCTGIYTQPQVEKWAELVEGIHRVMVQKIGIELNHAGRRGSTRPRAEGLDRPLRQGNWPLVSASAIPYGQQSQVPKEMTSEDMQRVCQEFVRSAQWALDAGFDLLQLNMAHGYLLASFLSPLTNRRDDAYGGSLEQRMRYPLDIFDAVRSCLAC